MGTLANPRGRTPSPQSRPTASLTSTTMGNSASQRVKVTTKEQPVDASLKETRKRQRKLWHMYGKCYDFTPFLKQHPGGADALETARGLPDATALFESYHPIVPKITLEKYYVEPSATAIKTEHGYTYKKGGFYDKVKNRVKDAMVKEGYGKGYWKGNWGTYLFSVVHFGILAYMSYALVSSWGADTCWCILAAMACVNGVFRGLMITRDAHAASHFAYSPSPLVNRVVYRLAMCAMGGSAEHWTNQHVQRHHIETSIIPIDYDTMYPVKRVLSSYKPLWFHKYQHIYMWMLYPITMLAWTLGDLAYAFHPRVPADAKLKSLAISFTFMLHARVLPFLVLPAMTAMWFVYLEIIVSSCFFSAQFVVNHEVEGTHGHSTYQDWGQYQTVSSHDYAVDSWLWCHLSGSLNNQIAHHLFPSVHFVHYPLITKVIREVCAEEQVEFQHSPSMLSALSKHHDHLYSMGNSLKEKKSRKA